jgi:predicted ATP-grasp superfamily ATP-dependent carboligase
VYYIVVLFSFELQGAPKSNRILSLGAFLYDSAMSAIILDGQLKSALSAVRSLGKAGVTFSVGAERKTAMSLHSRYTISTFVYPSPYTDRDGFIKVVIQEAERGTLVFPEEKSVEIAFDKAATYSLAHVSSVPTITTHTPVTNEEVRMVSETLSYPAVVKPRKSVTWKEGKGIFGSVNFVHTKEKLIEKFFSLRDASGEAPLIQELILGEEYGVEMLAVGGLIYGEVTHHRIRSLSPTGGASVLKETLTAGNLKSTLEAYAEILVRKLAWSGPIMVEFKVDSDSQKPYLMEINGRFWGSLPLSVASGVDMPYLFYRKATGEEISGVVTGREGVRTNHFLGEVRHLIRVLFARDPMRKHLYPKRLDALKDFIKPKLGVEDDVWSFHDPKPAIMEVVDTIKKYTQK